VICKRDNCKQSQTDESSERDISQTLTTAKLQPKKERLTNETSVLNSVWFTFLYTQVQIPGQVRSMIQNCWVRSAALELQFLEWSRVIPLMSLLLFICVPGLPLNFLHLYTCLVLQVLFLLSLNLNLNFTMPRTGQYLSRSRSWNPSFLGLLHCLLFKASLYNLTDGFLSASKFGATSCSSNLGKRLWFSSTFSPSALFPSFPLSSSITTPAWSSFLKRWYGWRALRLRCALRYAMRLRILFYL